MKAYCYASGEIEFGRNVPEGALLIAKAPVKILRPIIEVVARHAYDGTTLLVPGIPEAPDQNVGIDALRRFREQVRIRLDRRQAA